jgi:crossover junction endodeoxyribonuclease RusA
MTNAYTFSIPGEPVTQGNMSAYVVGGVARIVHKDAKGLERFRQDARAAKHPSFPYIESGAVHMTVVFVLARPRSHYGTGRNSDRLKASAPHWHAGMRGDWDKYGRAASDALTSVCWRDDGQLAQVLVQKRYADAGEAPHTVVTYGPLADE